ncbi:Mce-associated membrane protein [Streptomyces fulvorobeus]|uniref:Mce-associated membrane protein n=1 Tax=Streptomyces fulvorobeus TaxID=284028 RepID=A0A7Y9HGH0_9ACTN|nr:Mce-associated membrane protein [Streptomyces fulvorobeus]
MSTAKDTQDSEAKDPVRPAAPADDTADTGPTRETSRRWPRIAGAASAAALLVAGCLLFAEGRQLRDTAATSNRALTDPEATAEVVGEVSNALGRVFSYSPQATAATKASAKEVLAGKALVQYAALFGQVEKQAADQRLTLTSQVVRAGVTRLTGRGAHLLVFLDQVYERRGKAPSTAAAQLSVSAEHRGGRWYIVEITSR